MKRSKLMKRLLTLVSCLFMLSLANPALSFDPNATERKLMASDGAIDDEFGKSVSMSGDYAIVGAYGDDDKGTESGSAYIFDRTGGSWSQVAKLTASDGAADDHFGYSVSMSGDYAIVGAYGDDDNGTESGSAYLFEKPGTGWSNMTETAKLTASDGAADDRFGYSISISGDYAIVGAEYDDDNGTESGSAYIFKKPVAGWANMTQTAKLTASDGALGDWFGYSVSISGDYAIVGTLLDDDNGLNSGSAYLFEKPVAGWANMTETAKLTASDGGILHRFGISVSISGDYAIVGARGDDDNGIASGSAYLFEKPGTGWANMTETAKLTASDGAPNDQFGNSVSISGDYAIVGANFDDDNGTESGSAYSYRISGCLPCFADYGGMVQKDQDGKVSVDTGIWVFNPNTKRNLKARIFVYDKSGTEVAVSLLFDGGTPALIPPMGYGWITLGMLVGPCEAQKFGFHLKFSKGDYVSKCPVVEIKEVIYNQPVLPDEIHNPQAIKSWSVTSLGGPNGTGFRWQ
jgi:hypothetical protein